MATNTTHLLVHHQRHQDPTLSAAVMTTGVVVVVDLPPPPPFPLLPDTMHRLAVMSMPMATAVVDHPSKMLLSGHV